MFDKAEIVVKAGKGGDGAISFRREKFVPLGGPDGGDGGDGGDVVIKADVAVNNLRLFKQKGHYRAANGEGGSSKKRHGKRGEDRQLSVPVGTVILSKTPLGGDDVMADLEQPGQSVVVTKGGKGGLGNTHFASSTNQVPRVAQQGEDGEEQALILELRLIADVGIIGYPNAGKSTLLAAASAAQPKVAGYPFTTREPVLGVVEVGQQTFVLAEIPGLIDGAHLGRGLGHDFLRHVVRTKIVIHLIDGTAADPVEAMNGVNTELRLFDSALARKPQVIVVNKIDLAEVRARVDEIRDTFTQAGMSVLFVAAKTGEGIAELMQAVVSRLSEVKVETRAGWEIPKKVFRPKPVSTGYRIHREGDTFVLEAPKVARLVARTGMDNPEVRRQLYGQLDRLGVNKALVKAGIKPGDKVRCGDFEWEW